MGKSITLFRQLQAWLPRRQFQNAVDAAGGDYKVQRATCWSHGLCLMLALLLHRQSLRDIESTLRSRFTYLRQFGIGSIDRSTISHSGEHRPSTVMDRLFAALRDQAVAVVPRHPFRFHGPLCSIDATVIQVSSTLFEWARCAPNESGIKLHIFFSHDGGIPHLAEIKTLQESELHLARRKSYAPGTVLCFDRGYFDTAWLAELSRDHVIFVTRLQSARVRYRVVRERPVDPATGIIADQIICFAGRVAREKCSRRLRLITYYDAKTERTYQFLSNQMTWSAWTICEIYKSRWQIELFFKWIKQHLKVTTFYGRDENAVRWQLMAALCLFLLLAILKYQNHLEMSLLTLQRLIEHHLFDPVELADLLHENYQFQT